MKLKNADALACVVCVPIGLICCGVALGAAFAYPSHALAFIAGASLMYLSWWCIDNHDNAQRHDSLLWQNMQKRQERPQ